MVSRELTISIVRPALKMRSGLDVIFLECPLTLYSAEKLENQGGSDFRSSPFFLKTRFNSFAQAKVGFANETSGISNASYLSK